MAKVDEETLQRIYEQIFEPPFLSSMCKWLGGFRLLRNESCDVSKSWWERHGVCVINVVQLSEYEEMHAKIAFVALIALAVGLVVMTTGFVTLYNARTWFSSWYVV